MRQSLLPRLLLPFILVLVAIALAIYFYSDRNIQKLHLETLGEGGIRQARLLGMLLPWDISGGELDALCARLAPEITARITVIARDGSALCESDAPPRTLENHAHRPEVIRAWEIGEGHDARVSASLHRPLYYSAYRQVLGDKERLIRLGVSIEGIQAVRSQIQMAVLVGFLAAVVIAFGPAMVLSRRLSRRVERLAHYSQQVTRGERIERLVPAGSDAVSRLEANMGQLALNLSDQVYAAREEKGRLEAVLRGMVEGVLVLDGQGTVVLSNRRAEELFDLPEGESCAGRRLIELTRHPELHELVRRVMRTENGGHPITEDVALDPSRRSVLQVSASPIRSEDGVFRTFILVCHDISELQRLEATRRDFVANVSHELRTPLAAIRGYSETLQTGALEDPENARRFLGIIERHAERLGRLVDDLLTLSDLELGKADLQKRETHIATVVESACEVLQAKATNAGVILQAQVAPQLPPLIADSDRLVQVLLNLVDNAIKYSPRGGTVVISAGPASVAGERKAGIELAVADDGVGVPPADLPRLTERFYRVDRARSRELGGTGLGLAIVKHIVQAHGGSLRIESEPGQGTTVRVYVPLAA